MRDYKEEHNIEMAKIDKLITTITHLLHVEEDDSYEVTIFKKGFGLIIRWATENHRQNKEINRLRQVLIKKDCRHSKGEEGDGEE